jgi:threonine aldolase
VAAQFRALLADDLWLDNAAHANGMARRLAAGVAQVPGVTSAYPVEANGVFAALPGDVTEESQRHYPFYVWDAPSGVVRWMTSFDTTEQDIDEFVDLVVGLMADHNP